MAADPEILLCMTCPYRPVDAETGNKVEGGLRIGERTTKAGRAVVIYSTEDPRNNSQFGFVESSNVFAVAEKARKCTPFVSGLEASTNSIESRLKKAAADVGKKPCGLWVDLFINNNLPEDLLYQTAQTVKE